MEILSFDIGLRQIKARIHQSFLRRGPQVWSAIIAVVSAIPVVGHLVKCSFANHREAVKEFLPSIAFSTATFWLSAIFLMGLQSNSKREFSEVLMSNMESGELLIFSLAFLGSIIVSAAEDPAKARVFPGRAWHFFVVFGVALIASGFYALISVSREAQELPLDSGYVLQASLSVAALAIVLAYLTLVYRKQTFDPEAELKGREGDFADEFERSLEK